MPNEKEERQDYPEYPRCKQCSLIKGKRITFIMERKINYIMNNEITWIECDGGPHLLLESKYLKIWKGENKDEYKKASEYYEETCLIDEYIGELSIGSGKCIVISDDITSSTWISHGNTGGFLVVINYVGEKYLNEGLKFDTLYNEISKIEDDQFIDTNLKYQVTDEELYLFAACDYGKEWIYNHCKFNLLPGNYSIKMIEEYIFDDSNFRVFKFNLMTI